MNNDINNMQKKVKVVFYKSKDTTKQAGTYIHGDLIMFQDDVVVKQLKTYFASKELNL
jgi:hypothetical protein